jgi:hypothetical protein
MAMIWPLFLTGEVGPGEVVERHSFDSRAIFCNRHATANYCTNIAALPCGRRPQSTMSSSILPWERESGHREAHKHKGIFPGNGVQRFTGGSRPAGRLPRLISDGFRPAFSTIRDPGTFFFMCHSFMGVFVRRNDVPHSIHIGSRVAEG